MAIINTGLLTKGLRSEFFTRFDATATHYQDLASRIQSTSDSESYKWLGSVPKMREWGTGRVARGLRTESYSVENLKYESTLEVDRDEIADDKTGQIRIRIAEMAQRAARHKDYLIAQLLINGESAGYHSYDGVPFLGETHESGSSGVQSNVSGSYAADADAPTAEEFKTSLQVAIGKLMGLSDDQGDPMATSAAGLVCVVPTNMYVAALEAVSATVVDSTTNTMQGAARIVPFPWLPAATKWYLLKTDPAVGPLIFQDREPVEFTALTQDSDEGFRREKFLYGVRARYRITYGYWQYALRMQFTQVI